MNYPAMKGQVMKDSYEHELLTKLGPGSYRAGLVEQITRDMQTLRQIGRDGFSPLTTDEAFYLDRIETYQQALSEIDLQIADRG
jgi:hypothetical protein